MACLFHKWKGCVCSKCGKSRHVWEMADGDVFEVCRLCGAIRFGDQDDGAPLHYRIRDNMKPQGKPRVYFCCHKNDFVKTFKSVTDEILGVRKNAAIWFRDPTKSYPPGDFLSYLEQMQLFVVPVTSDFLYTDDPARTIDLAYALENHIPVLPLMQEAGLDRDFNRIVGDLQFLDKNAASNDPTSLPYEAKLKSFLDSVLVGDELAEKIRDAFEAYIFLSYRKKDRAVAQKIMRLIHSSDFCRDLAIWYDEFLTPGENFNEEIEAAMKKSSLFAMVVTPSLLEDPNYVQTTEYPAAKNMNKKLLPIEAVDTDANLLAKMYEGLGDCFSAGDPEGIAARLEELIGGFVLKENKDDPMHEFLIGLAYLAGVDVEIDHDRAVRLITMAAEADLSEAYEKLVAMYQNGEGVERNWKTAIDWQEKYVDLLERQAQSDPSAAAYERLFAALWQLSNYQADAGEHDSAFITADRLLACAEEENRRGSTQAGHDLYIAYNRQGAKASAGEDPRAAKEWFLKGLEYSRAAAESCSEKDRHNLAVSYEHLGTACFNMGEYDEAREWFEKDLEISKTLAEETGRPLFRRDLGIAYSGLGNVCVQEDHGDEAKGWYEKARNVIESVVDGSDKPLYRRILADLYRKLAGVIGAQGEFEGALELYEKSFEIYNELTDEKWSPADRYDMCMARAWVGNLYEYMGEKPEAIRQYEEAISLAESLKGELDRRAFADLYETLANLNYEAKKADKAFEWQKKSLALRTALAEANPDSIEDKISLSNAYLEMGKIGLCTYDVSRAEGDSWYVKGYELALEAARESDSDEAQRHLYDADNRMGFHYYSSDPEKAAMHYERTKEYMLSHIDETVTPDQGMRLAWVYGALGTQYRNLKDLDKAIDYDEKKLEIYLKNNDQEKIEFTRHHIMWVYRKAAKEALEKGDLRKGRDLYERCIKCAIENDERDPFFHCLDRMIKIHEEMAKWPDYSAEEKRKTLTELAEYCRIVMRREPSHLYYRDYAKKAEKELKCLGKE